MQVRLCFLHEWGWGRPDAGVEEALSTADHDVLAVSSLISECAESIICGRLAVQGMQRARGLARYGFNLNWDGMTLAFDASCEDQMAICPQSMLIQIYYIFSLKRVVFF